MDDGSTGGAAGILYASLKHRRISMASSAGWAGSSGGGAAPNSSQHFQDRSSIGGAEPKPHHYDVVSSAVLHYGKDR